MGTVIHRTVISMGRIIRQVIRRDGYFGYFHVTVMSMGTVQQRSFWVNLRDIKGAVKTYEGAFNLRPRRSIKGRMKVALRGGERGIVFWSLWAVICKIRQIRSNCFEF